MKRTARQYVQAPTTEKITEKALNTRIAISVTLIILSLIAMAFSAYAYFSSDVAAKNNTIKSAIFDTEIVILHKPIVSQIDATPTDGEESEPVAVPSYTRLEITKGKNFYSAQLKAGINQVTITPTGTAETGYCIVDFVDYCDIVYYTQQIGVDYNTPTRYTASLTFILNVAADTPVYIVPNWGTSSYSSNDECYISANESITVNLNNVPKQSSEADKSTSTTEKAPIEDTSVKDTPVEETPVEETPVEETPVEETPVVDTPVVDTPVADTPVVDTPVVDTPVVDTPVIETQSPQAPAEEAPQSVTSADTNEEQ